MGGLSVVGEHVVETKLKTQSSQWMEVGEVEPPSGFKSGLAYFTDSHHRSRARQSSQQTGVTLSCLPSSASISVSFVVCGHF